MVKIVTFEGSDLAGKTTTSNHLFNKLKEKYETRLNEGPINTNDVFSHLSQLAKNTNNLQRELLYTMGFILDKCLDQEYHGGAVVIEDRYWPSVVAYGRFLNGNKSIHNGFDFRMLFIEPVAVIYLKCTLEEKIKRAKKRKRKSILDLSVLSSPETVHRLEYEIERSIDGLPNIIQLDTTYENIDSVSSRIELFLKERGILV